MSQYLQIVNARTGRTIVARAKLCRGFFCSLRGLAFSRSLTEDRGLVFERRRESRLLAGMHTLGMRYNIAIVWLDRELSVVEMRNAPPWRIANLPSRAAKYVIEALPETLNRIAPGDRLIFNEVSN